MALITRYRGNEKGAIVITGNTLGLSRLKETSNPGTEHAINQFITTNTLVATPLGWGGIVNLNRGENITFDWRRNSSSAFLNMLSGYSVLYAELVWGGMSVSNSTGGGTVDVTPYIDNVVVMTTPQ